MLYSTICSYSHKQGDSLHFSQRITVQSISFAEWNGLPFYSTALQMKILYSTKLPTYMQKSCFWDNLVRCVAAWMIRGDSMASALGLWGMVAPERDYNEDRQCVCFSKGPRICVCWVWVSTGRSLEQLLPRKPTWHEHTMSCTPGHLLWLYQRDSDMYGLQLSV